MNSNFGIDDREDGKKMVKGDKRKERQAGDK